jgi:hypothetical protein
MHPLQLNFLSAFIQKEALHYNECEVWPVVRFAGATSRRSTERLTDPLRSCNAYCPARDLRAVSESNI